MKHDFEALGNKIKDLYEFIPLSLEIMSNILQLVYFLI